MPYSLFDFVPVATVCFPSTRPKAAPTLPGTVWAMRDKTTFYVYEAGGKAMAVYTKICEAPLPEEDPRTPDTMVPGDLCANENGTTEIPPDPNH